MKDTPIEIKNEIRKEFSFKKNDVTLSFTLRIDMKQQLKDFQECMTHAQKAITEELAKIK